MEFSTVLKKKKRKTRKCLDEIRKRSRHTKSSECYGEPFQQHAKNNKTKGTHTDSHRLVTMNRLTLNMFPKAIRSETITRPLLEEMKHKLSYTYEDLNKSVKVSSAPKNHQKIHDSMPMIDLKESLQEHESSLTSSSLKNLQNSHIHILEKPAGCLTRVYSTSSTTSLSSETLDGDHGHELYEELMNKISSHLKKVTSAVINEDVLKNTKVKLQKLYNSSWSQEYQTCKLKLGKLNKPTATTIQCSKDSLTQNPLEYIRLKHVQHESMYDECHLSTSESLSSPEAVTASVVSDSPLTFGKETNHDVALYDTPEYNYYPHRLN